MKKNKEVEHPFLYAVSALLVLVLFVHYRSLPNENSQSLHGGHPGNAFFLFLD